MVDWEQVKMEYITGDLTQNELAAKHKLTRSCLAMRVKREYWKEEREIYRKALQKKQEPDEEAYEAVLRARCHREKQERMDNVVGQLLDKIGQAITELDVQVLRTVRKEKEFLYDHPQRADKATCEILVESETLTTVKCPVDRNGIKLLAAALKDLKEVQMLRDPMELKEQEAKVAKLMKEVEGSEDRDKGSIRITFAGETRECSL